MSDVGKVRNTPDHVNVQRARRQSKKTQTAGRQTRRQKKRTRSQRMVLLVPGLYTTENEWKTVWFELNQASNNHGLLEVFIFSYDQLGLVPKILK